MIGTFISLLALIGGAAAQYPVPIPPGGRRDVHGWLILPMDQDKPSNPSTPLRAWFSHHVPELFKDSPHNFQIILEGSLVPVASIKGEVYPFEMPYPPTDSLINYEYTFTPPSPFSLNDLLSGDIREMRGVFYNGSFDTPYERQASNLALLHVHDLTTATYLDEFETDAFEYMRYLAYPRGKTSEHFYFAHEIRAAPDFDHIVHGTLSMCTGRDGSPIPTDGFVQTPGSSWEISSLPNTLEYKLQPGQVCMSSLC